MLLGVRKNNMAASSVLLQCGEESGMNSGRVSIVAVLRVGGNRAL